MGIKVFSFYLIFFLIFSSQGLGRKYYDESLLINLKAMDHGDTFITNKNPETNYGDHKYIVAGVKDGYQYWALFFFSLPSYEGQVIVRNAELILSPVLLENPESYDFHYILHRFFPSDIYMGSNIEKIGARWKTMPNFDTYPAISFYFEHTEERVKINISRLVQRAFDDNRNYCGILLKNSVDFASSRDSYIVFYSSNNFHPSYNDFVPQIKMRLLIETSNEE